MPKSALPPGRMRVAKSLDTVPAKPGVYRFISIKTGKCLYVGQTDNLRRRAKEHLRDRKLKPKIHKFCYGVAKSGRKDGLCETEIKHIAKHQPKMNKTRGGNGRR